MKKLLPCPFCGAEAEILRTGNEYTKTRSITIRCPKCRTKRKESGIVLSLDELEEIAIRNWNTRSCYPAEFVEWIGRNYDPITAKNKSYWIEKIIGTRALTAKKLFKLWKDKKDIIG